MHMAQGPPDGPQEPAAAIESLHLWAAEGGPRPRAVPAAAGAGAPGAYGQAA